MTWLYVPGTSSPSAQASEALNSASLSPSTIGERLHEASATWRGKPQPPQAWSRRWRQAGFIQRLSGLTLPPSTADRGVASWISSLRETRAKTTATPGSVPGRTASAFSPRWSVGSPRSAGLLLSSARTSPAMQPANSRPSCLSWKGWAIALRQEYSARTKPMASSADAGCSLWPRPTVTDSIGARNDTSRRREGSQHHSGKTLTDAAIERTMPHLLDGNGQVAAMDFGLCPRFVEKLMRWPIGLSGFARPGTAWTRWWQLMPSFLSMLVSEPQPDQMELFAA